MEKLFVVLSFIQTYVIGKPYIFLALMVLACCIVLRKNIKDVYINVLHVAVGYLMLTIGGNGLKSVMRPILMALNGRFNVSAIMLDGGIGRPTWLARLDNLGVALSWTFVAFAIGFAWNILLVAFRKYTKVRSLNTTAHLLISQPICIACVLFSMCPGLQNLPGSILVGILAGTYWAVGSNLTVEATQELTDGGGFCVGHQQMFGVFLADKLAPKIGGKKHKKLSEIQFPGFFAIFSDNVAATATLMFLFFGVILAIIGPQYMAGMEGSGYTEGSNYFMFVVEQTVTIVVYLQVMLAGVRRFVGIIAPLFTEIAAKAGIDAMPGLDCAVTFGFAGPSTVSVGFISGLIGQVICIALLIIFKSPILIITGFIPVFFDNATIAIFADNKGGAKAAVLLPFINGCLQILLGALCIGILGFTDYAGWYGNIDWDTLWLPFYILCKYWHIVGALIFLFVMLAIPHLQYRTHKDTYFRYVSDYAGLKAERLEKETKN